MKTCNKCGLLFSGERCKPCKSIYRKNYYKNNKNKENESNKNWIKNNQEKRDKYNLIYFLKNKDFLNSKKKIYRLKNKKNIQTYLSKWKKDNREHVLNYASNYSLKNKISRRINEQKRRSIKKKSFGTVSKDIVNKLTFLQKNKCAICMKVINGNFHLDHIIPLALGGENNDLNLQIVHQICNQRKYAKHPIDFMQENGFLL